MAFQQRHAEKISDWTADQYAAWLLRGFGELLSGGRELIGAFKPVMDGLSPRDHVEPQIAELFHLLSETDRQSFLEGLSRAVQSLSGSEEDYSLFDSFALLVAKVDRPEPCDTLAGRLCDSSFLASADEVTRRRLFARIFLVLAGLSHAPDVANRLRALIGATLFRAEYGTLALDALNRAEPDKFFEHVKLLDRCWTHTDEKDKALNRVQHMIRQTGLDAFGSAFHFYDRDLVWILSGLRGKIDYVVDDNEKVYFQWRDDSASRADITEHDSEYAYAAALDITRLGADQNDDLTALEGVDEVPQQVLFLFTAIEQRNGPRLNGA